MLYYINILLYHINNIHKCTILYIYKIKVKLETFKNTIRNLTIKILINSTLIKKEGTILYFPLLEVLVFINTNIFYKYGST